MLDEEHLMELLKRLKQQSENIVNTMANDDESNLFETMLGKFFCFEKKKKTIDMNFLF